MGRETKNNVLQKALTLYLTEANVPFEQRAQVSLTALHDVSVPVQRNPATDQFDPLARYRLTWNAPDNEWVEIEKGLFFQQRTHRDSSPEDDGDSFGGSPPAREFIIFELKCSKREGPAKIDEFLERALSWYKSELMKMKDVRIPLPDGSTKDASATSKRRRGPRVHVQAVQALGPQDGQLLFFREGEILRLLDDFEKRGKYSIAGYPHKLGLLLHGPPGTGKTSRSRRWPTTPADR